MRILYLADIRFPLERANGIQTMATCHALALRGHRVTLLVRPDTQRPARDPFEFYAVDHTPHLRIVSVPGRHSGIAGRLTYLAAVARQILTSGPWDVVITRDLGVASALVLVPRPRHPVLVYESHGFAPRVSAAMPDLLEGGQAGSPAKLRRLRNRERRVWRHADAYVTITVALADELASLFGPRPRHATIPDGCRLEPSRSFAEPRHRDVPTVAYAGHLYPWKGVTVLLHALASLPNVTGLIIGGHPGERDLARTREEAVRLGLDDRVTFTGLLDPGAVARRLADAADILVLPNTETVLSARYTSPLKLFEYMAAGKPIVASKLASLDDVLRHDQNALLVRPDDPKALAASIDRLVQQPELARRLARCAFDDAAGYTWDRRAERLELRTKYLDDALHVDARHETVSPPLLTAGVKHRMLRRMLAIDASDRVLDLGCGSGRVLVWDQGRAEHAVGLDVSPFFAKEALDDVDLTLGDLRRLPFDERSFTKAYALDVFEHLSRSALEEVLREAARVFVPGGTLFAYSHVRRNSRLALGLRWINALGTRLDRLGLIDTAQERLRKSDHINPLVDIDDLRRVGAQAGFRLARIRYYTPLLGAFIENIVVRIIDQFLTRRAARRLESAAATPDGPVADVARRTARTAAKQRLASHGPTYMVLRALTWLIMLDVVLFGHVRSGPYFALFVKDTPETERSER